MAQDESPDLTHVRLVKAGDNLPSLCDAIYGDPQMYLKVAEANGIDDFRRLVPGTRIFFPPLEK
jgi:nucleoid-associated protein YgaU